MYDRSVNRTFTFGVVLALASPAAADVQFFAEIPDLPLPPGYAERAPATVFESDNGRIVTAEAYGRGEMMPVRDFYLATLPQLGWAESVEDQALVFVRGRERLTFFIERVDGRVRLRAQLAVAPASMRLD